MNSTFINSGANPSRRRGASNASSKRGTYMNAVLLNDVDWKDFSNKAMHVPAGTCVVVDTEYMCFVWGDSNIDIREEDYAILN